MGTDVNLGVCLLQVFGLKLLTFNFRAQVCFMELSNPITSWWATRVPREGCVMQSLLRAAPHSLVPEACSPGKERLATRRPALTEYRQRISESETTT